MNKKYIDRGLSLYISIFSFFTLLLAAGYGFINVKLMLILAIVSWVITGLLGIWLLLQRTETHHRALRVITGVMAIVLGGISFLPAWMLYSLHMNTPKKQQPKEELRPELDMH